MRLKDYTRQIILTILLLAVVAVAVILCVQLISARAGSDPTMPETPTEGVVYYTLGEYDGKIAVFQNTQEEPIEVFDVYQSVLPAVDQERLKAGMMTTDRQTLNQWIEDYTS